MQVVSLNKEHLYKLSLQPSQAYLRDYIDVPGYYEQLISGGYAFAGIRGDTVVAAAGVVMTQSHVALAWALLSDAITPRSMISVHRAVKDFIDTSPIRRIEMHVRADAPESAKRWAGMLGFEYEGTMRSYSLDGVDCDLYARIKDGRA